MRKYWWIVPLAMLHALDGITTAIAGLGLEGNPNVVYIWTNYGFVTLASLKFLHVIWSVLIIYICTHRCNPFRTFFTKACQIEMAIVTVILSLVVAWNACWLL